MISSINYKFITLLIAYCVSSWSISALYAQEKELARAKEYIAKAEKLYEDLNYNAALGEYLFASEIYRRLNLADKFAICYNGIGNIQINLSNYDQAMNEFRRTIQKFDELKLADPNFIPDSMLIADAYEGFGRYYSNKNSQFDSSLIWHQKALDIRIRTVGERHPKVALSYYFIGELYKDIKLDSTALALNQSNQSLQEEYLNKALKIQLNIEPSNPAQLADTYEALGNYYYDINNMQSYEEGEKLHRKALELRKMRFSDEHPAVAISHINLAKYYGKVNRYAEETEELEKALSIQERVFESNHKDIAITLQALAKRYRLNGDVDKALYLYNRAASIITLRSGEFSNELAEVYLDIANCYNALDKLDEQKKYLDSVHLIWKKIYGENHKLIGVVKTQLGLLYLQLAKQNTVRYLHSYVALAESHLTDVLTLWEKTLSPNHLWIADAYDNLAQVYAFRGDLEQEFEYLQKSLSLKTKGNTLSSVQHQELADDLNDIEPLASPSQLYESHLKLAQHYFNKKKFLESLISCQTSLTWLIPSLNKDGSKFEINPSIEDLSKNLAAFDAISFKAKVLLEDYKYNKHEKYLPLAVSTSELALKLIDTLRTNFTGDVSKEQLTKRAIPVYETAIEAQYLLYQQSSDSVHIERAFTIMEHSKAFILMQSIQNTVARNAGLVPNALLGKEETLRRNLASLLEEKTRFIYKNPKTKDEKQNKKIEEQKLKLEKEYFEARSAYDSLIVYIEKTYPKYYQLKYAQPNISIKDIQKKALRKEEAILEYFIGDNNIYVFIIERDGVKFYRKPYNKQESLSIDSLRTNLTDYSLISNNPELAFRTFIKHSHNVHKAFVKPFLNRELIGDNIKKLIIISDGLLSSIPFEVLVQEYISDSIKCSYKDLPMMIKDYEINYSYSSNLLLQNIQNKRRNHNGMCIGFAPTYKDTEDNTELPWAEKELQAIANNFKGLFFYGNDANKANFLKEAQKYGVIHLAMHGILDMKNPQKSHLAFTEQAHDSLGILSNLYNYEIQDLDLFAELVVLSACETGYGKVIRGEGVLSLSRGFMLAGASSIVTTLWKVNDYTSATLMTLFYQNLNNGMDKPAALRNAKMEFLSKTDKTSGHPAFWSSFISLGNPAPIKQGGAWWIYAIGIGLFIGSTAVGYKFWQKKKVNKVA